MKIINCNQGSGEWLAARCGKPSASRFKEIITPTGKAVTGEKRRRYLLELLGERLTGRTAEHFTTAAMDRGTLLEPRGRAWYELETGQTVERVGFVLRDDGRSGASPDGLTDHGGIEIKCLGIVPMLDMIESDTVDTDHFIQMQGCMWVCERQSWDYVLFTDAVGIPNRVKTLPRSQPFCDALGLALAAFCDELDAAEKKLLEMGGGCKLELTIEGAGEPVTIQPENKNGDAPKTGRPSKEEIAELRKQAAGVIAATDPRTAEGDEYTPTSLIEEIAKKKVAAMTCADLDATRDALADMVRPEAVA